MLVTFGQGDELRRHCADCMGSTQVDLEQKELPTRVSFPEELKDEVFREAWSLEAPVGPPWFLTNNKGCS